MKALSNSWTNKKGVTYTYSWIPNIDPKIIGPINQCYGFCYNKAGKLLVIDANAPGLWQVPGGTPEDDETFEETLRREIIEEANVIIKNISYLDAQRVTNNKDNLVKYQLRYACLVDKILPRMIDPAEGRILKRKFIKPSSYNQLADWGPIGDELVRLSMEKMNILR